MKIYSRVYRHLRKKQCKMKSFKLFTLIIMSGFIIAMISCDSAKQKVTNEKENVTEAEKQLEEAQDDYLADVEKHRIMYSERLLP